MSHLVATSKESNRYHTPWEVNPPSPDTCGVCGGTIVPDEKGLYLEARPTGIAGSTQEWPYCLKCWLSRRSLEFDPLAPLGLLGQIKPFKSLDQVLRDNFGRGGRVLEHR